MRLWLMLFAILFCAFAVEKAEAAEIVPGQACAHPGESTMASIRNPGTGKMGFYRIVCVYVTAGAGWQWGMMDQFKE